MIPIGDETHRPRRRFPFFMFLLLIANILVFVYEMSLGERELQRFFLSAGVIPVEYTAGQPIPPPPPGGITYLTLLTSMFIHGGFLHIASNMLYLFIFGDNVEDGMGHLGFLLFYVLCGIAAGLTHIFVNPGSQIPSVGASGAIAGVLAGYFLMFPRASVRTLLFLGPFITITRVPALLLIGFWFVTQFFSGLVSLGAASEQTTGVAFWAHIGGFIAGLILAPIFKRREPRRQRPGFG